ncbi:MAG: cation:proton antiporter [Clostridia bacterium]|nr:cation:proton antiporter [Clostridia bacterium]
MRTLFSVAFALVAGLLMTRPLSRFKLPDVTAYLIAGLLIGPSLLGGLNIPGLGFNNTEMLSALSILSDTALGFIAFSIGSEFRADALKQTGKQALVIGVFQAVVATLLVDLALLAFHFMFPEVLSIPAVITLGAIASATAPAATMMVVRQYKAKGELTKLLLPIVALDDAVGLVLFAVSFGAARAIADGKASLFIILAEPMIEIVGSLAIGGIAGWVLTQLEKLFHSNTNRLAMTVAFVLLTVALSMLEWEVAGIRIGFSSLLVCMMLGTVFANLCPLSEDLMGKADRWTAPLMVLFFVVSGAELELSVLASVAVVLAGVVYIVTRCIGKYYGAYVSAKATHCSPNVVKYLGITLFPQAGVALGMCVTARTLGADGELIRSIVLFAVLVYEIFGPLMTKWALTKAGDISPVPEEVKNRRETKLAEAAAKRAE